jgi:hypothetical protein
MAHTTSRQPRKAAPARATHEHDEVVWPQMLDILVWCAVVVIAALAVEFLAGYVIRERLANGFTKLLARRQPAPADEPEGSGG